MSQAPVLYQETRVSCATSPSSRVLHIDTSNSQPSHIFGAGRKRGIDEISGLDEEAYARKHLATEGSVFFRRKERAPRSFLWRVLDDRKVLELQSVDLVHGANSGKSESVLTFRVRLPGDIVRNGVAYGDPEDTDALEVFILTTSNELYTLTLKRDLLIREAAPKDFDVASCLKKYTSNSLAFRHPYRLVAANAQELYISLHDGGLLRLQRRANENGTQWRDTFFSNSGWSGTLKGLISLKRHQTVGYGNLELEPSAIAAIAKSPDGRIIWTVTLEHELKAWNAMTGKAVARIDLMNEHGYEDGRRGQKYIMSAEQGTLLQVVTLPPDPNEQSVARTDEDEQYFLVVHSPKDHRMKFYEVKTMFSSVEGDRIHFDDLQPRSPLIPPIDELLNTNIWHLEDFHVKPGPKWRDTQLWIRARSGTLCRVFSITFDLLDDNGEAADLDGSWQTGWTVVDMGMQTVDALHCLPDFPGDLKVVADNAGTPTERWLGYLFYPDRFSAASIETALNIYCKGRGLHSASNGKGIHAPEAPLKERLTQAISSKIILRRLPSEQPDYETYQIDIHTQWKTLFSLLSHLHSRRHASIGLAFDIEDALPWSVCSDFVAPIRASSQCEMLALNGHLCDQRDLLHAASEEIGNVVFPLDESMHQSVLLHAARTFSECLSAEFRERFIHSVIDEATNYEGMNLDHCRERVRNLYDNQNFHTEVMDDDYEALEKAAEGLGGLADLSENMLFGLLERMGSDADVHGQDQGKSLSRFGDKLTVTVAQETLQRDRRTLVDLLTLVVFMYGDLEDNDLHENFVGRIGEVYDALITRIKHNEMLSWLARHEVAEPQDHRRDSMAAQSTNAQAATITVLEYLYMGNWRPQAHPDDSMTVALTMWSKHWTYGANLFGAWDAVTSHVMAFLIKQQLYELASDYQKFLSHAEDSPSWLRYLQGRLLVATGEYARASLMFQAAATGMAGVRRLPGLDTAHLLSLDEQTHFGAGQSMYFQHVITIFEKLKVFSYMADFAYLALEQLDTGVDYAATLGEIDRRKGMADSPASNVISDSRQEVALLKISVQRDDIRDWLFNALVQTGRFEEAFSALVGIQKPPSRKQNLKVLIETCCKQNAVSELLDLSFEEGDLVQEADAVLLGLAKKSLASGSASGPPYHRILYAFRAQRSDFRGAAEILYEHLERSRSAQYKDGQMQDPEEQLLVQAYVLLINTLACCGEEDAWLLADPIEGLHGVTKKRRLVTLADVRRDYGDELDRRSDALHGRFPLVGGGDEMDVL